MLDHRSEGQAGKKIQRADQTAPCPDSKNEKRAAGDREGSCAGGAIFFCTSEPARAMIGTIMRKRPTNMAMPRVVLYQGVLRGQAGERAAVVAVGGTVGVKNFAQAVRAVVVQAGQCPICSRSPTPQSRG